MKTLFKFTSLFIFFIFAGGALAQQTEREAGIGLYKKGDYQGAIQVLKRVVKSDQADAESWYILGLAYLNKENTKDSLKAFKKAAELNGKDSKIHNGLAYVYLKKNNLGDAQREAREALALDDKNAETHYLLGVISFRNGSFNNAYEKAKKAIELNPKLAAAYQLKAESLVSSFSQQAGTVIKSQNARKELLKEAVTDLEKYVSLTPGDKDFDFQREYLRSLKFFAEYYGAPENNLPDNSDINQQTNADATPVEITYKPLASYTERARSANVSGVIRLLVGLSANGKVENVLIIKGLSHGLNEEAVKAARGIKFKPATRDGKPVSVVKTVEYTFTIY